MFPPQQPQQQYPPQQYAPQLPPQQQPQYPPPMAPQQYQPQAPPTANASIDDFYSQPSSAGGPTLSFSNKPIGASYVGIVARKITRGDIRQQTDMRTQQPQTYRDGSPKLVMVVPLLVNSPEFPEGTAAWWVKGQARDELVRAMSEAGAPEGPPEEGAALRITLASQRPIPGLNPQNIYRVEYQRPQNAGQQTPAPVEQPEQPQQPPPNPAPQPQQQPQQQQQVNTPPGLTPEQQQLLASLTGSN